MPKEKEKQYTKKDIISAIDYLGCEYPCEMIAGWKKCNSCKNGFTEKEIARIKKTLIGQLEERNVFYYL